MIFVEIFKFPALSFHQICSIEAHAIRGSGPGRFIQVVPQLDQMVMIIIRI